MWKMECLRRVPLLNILLFLLTVGTTLIAGTMQSGADPFKDIRDLRLGIPFSFTLLSILLFHELSHYFAAKSHRTITTLPYFIPAPTFLGTFGAVIKIKSPLPSRNALLDVGIAGPLASFSLSIVAVSVGLLTSPIVSAAPEGSMHLGDSIIFSGLVRLVKGPIPDGSDIMLGPVAFAGWIGFLVTAINLLPVSQLDGGHISYSLLGKRYLVAARGALLAMVVLGFRWPGWLFWAILIIVFGIRHPAPLDDITPVNRRRKVIGIVGFVILILTFVPRPFIVPMK